MSRSRVLTRPLKTLLAASLIFPLSVSATLPLAASADTGFQTGVVDGESTKPATDEPVPDDSAIPEPERDSALGQGWRESDDVAWTAVGDSTGFHVFTANMADGYRWQQIATLGADAVDTDRWIGNACLTGDADVLAVTYAPRSFTNDESMFLRGAFAAFVNLSTGEVTPLAGGYSLAYFSPGCGPGDTAVLAQYSDEGTTRVSEFTVADPENPVTTEISDVITSIVPTAAGLVGVAGRTIVGIDANGGVNTIVEAGGLAYDVTATGEGGIAYLQHDGERSQAMLIDSAGAAPVELAAGDVEMLGLAADAAGTVYVTGAPDSVAEALPSEIEVASGTATRSVPSSTGELMLESAAADTDQAGAALPAEESTDTVHIEAVVTETATPVDFALAADNLGAAVSGVESSNDKGRGVTVQSSSPISVSTCAVARNDPAIQAVQPRPAEVEWAVNQGIRQTLHSSFPLPSLNGGGRVPAQIMLGILAQESNFWQASKYVVPGVTGNPLVGNYFGVNRDSSSPNAWWQIDYSKADCGYGIAQVTDGMRSGEMPYAQQLAIAVDYKANIARGLQILIEKWNELRSAGMTINNGSPNYLENWFYALWTYNTGFKPQAGPGLPWGVGWVNNPINQIYPANRTSFLDGNPADAAHPQDWPYPEKVLGFAAHSVQFLDSVSQGPLGDSFTYKPAFTPAWWTSADNADGATYRQNVKPPLDLFCNSSNECNPTNQAAPCTRSDSKCWFHYSATWKDDCPSMCGYEYLNYSLGASKPSGANSFPSNCTRNGLPSGALIVDNLPNGTAPVRGGCTPVATTGSFQFNFPNDNSKIDVHQLGSGLNGQFYFSHTRVADTPASFGGALDFSGTWNLGQSLNGWAQVYVHMPSHGAWLQQASYAINTGTSTVTRSVNQRNYANEWVSLGTLQFAGTPTITLANDTARYTDQAKAIALSGVDDIAWDAVAFVPLAQKPTDFVVALGDSFSSGEGTSPGDGSGFYRGSDHHGSKVYNAAGEAGDDPNRNACHRSGAGWPNLINVPSGIPGTSIGALAQAKDPRIDFQLLACAGAETKNILTGATQGAESRFGELTQLDRGFLDSNTTLVTLTIGGNDVGFEPIVSTCVKGSLSAIAPAIPLCENMQAPADKFSGTLGDMATSRLNALTAKVKKVLEQVHSAAPNARVVMLGYPMLFESSGTCIQVPDTNKAWLNGIAERLDSTLMRAVAESGSFVSCQNPQYLFAGSNLCTSASAINGLMFSLTPGDSPLFTYNDPGPNFGLGTSAQSVHPNGKGSELYSFVANEAMRNQRIDLSASLTGGAATTYYSTFRIHASGPVSMNVSSFAACGNEIRFGLRKIDASNSGVFGQQHTNTLGWTASNKLQMFESTSGGRILSSGWYALNGRLTAGCTGGPTHAWQAQLFM